MSFQTAPPGLYVHVPFCGGKCAYCDFYSVPDVGQVAAWIDALEQETRHYREQFPCFATLYLGGGTPSLLAHADFTRLLKIIRNAFTIAPDAEITLEVNPEDATPENLSLWQGLGINRLSLGVEALNDANLAFLGRRHTARQARDALAACREAGFANVGVDLIYALPGQTEAAWAQTLAAALVYTPEHLSCYQLTVEPHTALGRRLARGQFQPAGDDAQAELFLFTHHFLEDRGYLHYEISNFARGADLVSRHNQAYWRHVPYLGLGPAAHSFDGRHRWWNHRSLTAYCRAAAQGAAPVAGRETLSPAQLRLEALMLDLRTKDGAPLSLLAQFPHSRASLPRLVGQGLLTIAHGCAVPTLAGWLVADRLPLLLTEP
jgi:oxygen-independent coproporphyrinogen-3 oxidase